MRKLPRKISLNRIPPVVLLVVLLLVCSGAMAQEQVVSGTVIDAETQIPLPGVNIFEKGTSNGTAADFDGNYSLQVSGPNAVLVVSYIGYLTQEIAVDGREEIDIAMGVDAGSLDEVVLVGYGSMKKSDLTGSVGSVGGEELAERNMTNPLEALQGNIPGVQIQSSTGRIGDGFDIVIRGKNSMGGSNGPLFVVDGVPVDDIDFLNPQDIDRMDILKDASSTAIYGSRGSNGVVIVTTKSGASARAGLNVSFETFYGIKEATRLPQMMDPQTWWRYHQSAYLATAAPNQADVTPELLQAAVSAGGRNSELFRRAEANEGFDWYDAVLQTGIQQNNYLNISGRSENGVGYNLGLGYQQETGLIANEDLEKYNFKLGVDHKINDKITAGANLTVSLTDQNLGSDVAMREAFRLNPFLTPYGVDGELFPQPGKLTDLEGNFLIDKTSTYNPLLEIQNSTDKIRRRNLIGTAFFQYNPLDWLSLKTTLSTSMDNSRRGRAWGALTNMGVSNNDLPSAQVNNMENFNYTWDNQVNVIHDFNEDHSINALGLFSLYSNTTETSFGSSRYMPFETSFYNVGSGEQGTFNLGSNFVNQKLVSYALRFNYSFKDKYLLTLSNRWDGSSLLSESNRWDTFPSAAVAWRLIEEDFLQDQNSVSDLKFRLSYGYTGNNIISPYSTINILNNQTFYDYNGATANGWIPSNLANNNLAWEKTREWNFGLDYGLFRDRIVGSVDVYNRLSQDLLMPQRLPRETGWLSTNANVGSVSNKGVEAVLTTRNIVTTDVAWTTTFTFTKNVNKIVEIYGQRTADDIGNNLFLGESVDAHFNYDFIGIWQADEAEEAASYGMEVGQEKLRDVNNDGQYTPDDRVILGSSNPDWSGSLFTSLRVKNFDLSASVITNQGVLVYSPFHANFTDTRDRGRQKLDIDWYIPANNAGLTPQVSNSYPQPRNEGSFWRNDGVGYYRDASFVKVKNIAIGYNFDENILERLKMQRLRVYANVLNPFVFTNYDGWDPEWAAASLNVGRPSSVTYQIGLNLNF